MCEFALYLIVFGCGVKCDKLETNRVETHLVKKERKCVLNFVIALNNT